MVGDMSADTAVVADVVVLTGEVGMVTAVVG